MLRSGGWLALVLLGVVGCEEKGPSPEIQVEGLVRAWELDIEAPVDLEFHRGSLYVLAGSNSPELWRVDLGERPIPPRLPTDGLPAGAGRLLESSGSSLLVAGEWSGDIYSVHTTGEVPSVATDSASPCSIPVRTVSPCAVTSTWTTSAGRSGRAAVIGSSDSHRRPAGFWWVAWTGETRLPPPLTRPPSPTILEAMNPTPTTRTTTTTTGRRAARVG